MGKTRVILTVDTEPSVAGAMADRQRHPPLFDEPVWGQVNGRSEALGFLSRTLADFELSATFFLETVHTAHFSPEPMGRCAAHLLEHDQDVQLHLHPVWRNFDPQAPLAQAVDDDSAAIDADELAAMITRGCDVIEKWTGQRPVALRTGNFDASLSVYQAMAQARLPLASNLCIAGRDYSESALQVCGGVHDIEGVRELAVNCFRDPGPLGRNRYRALQITACSGAELQQLLDQAHSQASQYVVVVTHPFEYLKRKDFRYQGLRPNRLVQQRLTGLCRFLRDNPQRFEVTTFAQIAAQALPAVQAGPQLRGSTGLSLARSLQNALNDRI